MDGNVVVRGAPREPQLARHSWARAKGLGSWRSVPSSEGRKLTIAFTPPSLRMTFFPFSRSPSPNLPQRQPPARSLGLPSWQLKPLGPIATAQQIIARETPLGLYKGLGAVVSGIVPKMAIRFASFEGECALAGAGNEGEARRRGRC